MNPIGSVTITDREGWSKEFELSSQLIHIGSDPANTIVLDPSRGSGAAPRHLQLLSLPTGTLRAVNLGDSDIAVGEVGDRMFASRSVMDLTHAECLRVGDFRLVFRLGGAAFEAAPGAAARPVAARPTPPVAAPLPQGARRAAQVEKTGQVIGLRLSLPEAVLRPDRPLEGVVSVRNLGREPGVQFRLEVEGLDPDCYDIGPGPILFPDVEKAVFLRLQHPRRSSPPAGPNEIHIRASAPDFYPGGSVTVSQEIEILPHFAHSMTLVPVE